MTISKRANLLVNILYYSLNAISVFAECPLQAVQQAQMCTESLGIVPQSGPKPFVDKGKVEIAKKACRENKLSDAVKCLQDIMEVCKGNTEREHFLRMMIDVENTRQSVEYFCNNLNIYEQNADCIASLHGEQQKCTREVRDNFKTKVGATQNMDVMMTSTCRFFNIAVRCTQTTLQPKCGQEAVDIVVKMLQGFRPPKCRELKFDPGYKVNTVDSKEGQQGGDQGNTGSSLFAANMPVLISASYLLTILNTVYD